MLNTPLHRTLPGGDDQRKTLTLADKVSAEDWEQDRLNTVHLLNNKRLAKPYSQLQGGGEIRVLTITKKKMQANLNYSKRNVSQLRENVFLKQNHLSPRHAEVVKDHQRFKM